MMPFVFFSTTQNNLCSIHNLQYLILLTLPEKLGVGKIGKPKSKMRGWGGRIFIYVFIHYNSQRWSKGVGVLGCPSMPLPRPCLSVLAAITALHPNVRNIRFLLVEFTNSIIKQSVTARGGRIQQTARIGLV